MISHQGGLERPVVLGPALRCVSDGTSTDVSLLSHVDKGIKLHPVLQLKGSQPHEWLFEWNSGALLKPGTGRSTRYGRGRIVASWPCR